MIRTGLLIILAVIALSHAAFAAEAVTMRSGAHEGYTRLVFDWPEATTYSIAKDASGHVKITFAKPAALDSHAVRIGEGSSIASIRQVSSGDAPLALEIVIPQGSRVRDFAADNKVIVDIYNTDKAKAEPSKKNVPAKPVKPPKPATPAMPAKPAPVVAAPQPLPEPLAAAPAPAALTTYGPDVITITSTEMTGLGVFMRGGWLWIAADRPDVAVPPQFSGPDKDRFGAFEQIKAVNGSVWRIKLPGPDSLKDMKIYGEGGGLIWKIIMTPQARAAHEIEPKRVMGGKQTARDGTVLWPLKGVTRVIDVTDPAVGDALKIVTVTHADQYAGAPWQFVDMETLPSIAGVTIKPHVDDLAVKRTDYGVEISRPDGLALSSDKDISRGLMHQEGQDAAPAAAPPPSPAQEGPPNLQSGEMHKIFDFERWMMGGPHALGTNQTILLGSMKDKDVDGQVQDLLTLAKMNLANDRGPEALGFLSLASEEMPAILNSPEFLALRGAAESLAGKYELAFRDMGMPSLNEYSELNYWRAYALAWLEDWKQAAQVMPGDFSLLLKYPQPLLEKLGPKLAEIALRGGDTGKAHVLLEELRKRKETPKPWTRAAMEYLQGQVDRQEGKLDDAEDIWKPLVTGKDDMFRVRAGLALTLQELERKKSTPAQAIDRLEGLRYAWRGDELEAQINFELGKLYLAQKQYMKAFTIMHDAAEMNQDSDIGKDIDATMRSEFKDLLLKDKTIAPLDAMTVYQEFQDLAPPGEDGNKIVQKLAERLVTTDLLGRAGDLLQKQVDTNLQGQEQANVALRLAAIALLNKDPQRAVGALEKAEVFYGQQPAGADRDNHLHEVTLLRARAMAQEGKTEDALSLLAKMGPVKDATRLRTEIAWQAGLWPDAADALQDLIVNENLDQGKPLTDYQADLILNRAVALNLGGDRVELANMLSRYGARMAKSTRAHLFEVITRPHSINVMTEQQTIQGIVGEVDMFKNFMDDYKTVTDKGEDLNTVQ